MAELDAMLRMLYDSPEANPDLLQIFAIHGDGDEDALAFDEFAQVGRSLYRAVLRQVSGVSLLTLKRFSLAGLLNSQTTQYGWIRCV